MGESFKVADLIKADPSINVNVQDSKGYTALHMAASMGHLEVVQVLLDAGKARIDQPDRMDRTALYKAACAGHPSIVDCLVRKGANVNKQDEGHATPLYGICEAACSTASGRDGVSGGVADTAYYQCAQILVNHKANATIKNSSGKSPLMMAVRSKNARLVQLLIDAGAIVDDKDSLGISVRDYTEGDRTIISILDGQRHVEPTFTSKPSVPASKPSSASASSRPTHCTSCATALNATVKFCSKCGTKV
eukprot:gene2616-3007_t